MPELMTYRKPTFRQADYEESADRCIGCIGKTKVAQFLAVCSRSKWSRHPTISPLLAPLATAGSNAAYKIISACSNAVVVYSYLADNSIDPKTR
jgi:hypothetical protein